MDGLATVPANGRCSHCSGVLVKLLAFDSCAGIYDNYKIAATGQVPGTGFSDPTAASNQNRDRTITSLAHGADKPGSGVH